MDSGRQRMDVNNGIVVSDSGQIQAGAIAVGPHARAEAENVSVSSGAPAATQVTDLRRQLAELVEQMRGSTSELPDADQLVETAQQADRELAKEQPNKHTVAGLLAGLSAGVTRVAGLAEAVGKIQQAVSGLF